MNNINISKRIPNITSIRFLLSLFVILLHIGEFSKNRGFPFFNDFAIFHRGHEAVCMFFSLSGFLIIKQLYVEKKQTNTINLKGFYLKRVLRIFPLYYLILIIGFLYYQLVLPFLGFEIENNYNFFHGLFLSISFFPNIFSTYSPGGILEILWSIGIEEQFYLFIAPLFLILPIKKTVLFLVLFTSLYFIFYFLGNIDFLRKYHMLYFYFSFGGLCSILLQNTSFTNIFKKTRYLTFSIFILFFTTNIFKDNTPLITYNLLSFILFGITISSLSIKPIKLLENKTLNYLGKISYGIYMYHAVVLQFVGLMYLKIISKLKLGNTLDIVIIHILVISITIIISHFSYKYYEGYFLNQKRKIKNTNNK